MPARRVHKRAFGSTLGGLLGGLGSAFMPIPGVDGRALGSFLGGMTGLRRGGRRKKAVKRKARGGK
jgi:hypothetical protein